MPKKTTEKKSGKLQWFFLIIFIPTLFAAIIAGVLLSILGVNVLDLGKNAASDLPVVSSFFEEEENETENEMSSRPTEKVLNEKDQEITELEQELEDKEEEIRSLEETLEDLQIEMETEEENTEQTNMELKELAQVYENMSAGKAADILAELETEQILRHMAEMNTESRAAIISKMEAERAAELIDALDE
ncbi:magnesium transporter MgtE N-terminal domain-containing protein [Alteribacillus sp. JSM 102045]|uniref:magnesium transporter MgtE N-terminal domain-containing protein n=1 Tax=Alteribacillus sp. JSM 102045 TaxID=1562101 RepID=UPI0035BEE4F7